MLNAFIVVGLLVLPILAGRRLEIDFRWAGVYAVIIGGLTYWAYAADKRWAKAGEWRLPEAFLHFLELLGGWPAAFLAQRWLRHKCSKHSYQFAFWLIVIVYQLLAFDSLQNWKLSRAAFNRLGAISDHRK